MRPNMMEFAIWSQQLFQPLRQIRHRLAFNPGCPVIAPGGNDNMVGVARHGVRKRFVSVDAKSTGKNRWADVDSTSSKV